MKNNWYRDAVEKASKKAVEEIKTQLYVRARQGGKNTLSMRIYNAGQELAMRITSPNADTRATAIAGMEKVLAEAKAFHGQPIDLRRHFCPVWCKDKAFYLTITLGAAAGALAIAGMTYAIKYLMVG